MEIKLHRSLAILAVAVCLTAQAFVVLPHHHHAGEDAPCFNIVHCIGHDSADHVEHDGCCHDHCTPDPETASDHSCHVRIDIPEPADIRSSHASPETPASYILMVFAEFFTTRQPAQFINNTAICRREPFVPDVSVAFLAESNSARAPSFPV